MAAKNKLSTKFACLNILKIGESATEDDMKLAYKNVAYMHHPDRPSEKACGQKFVEITEAYIKLRAMFFLEVPLCCESCSYSPPWEEILQRGPYQMNFFKTLFLEILTDYVLRRRFQSKKKQRLQTVEEKEEDAFYDYLLELQKDEGSSSMYSSDEWMTTDEDESDFESYEDWLEAKSQKKRHKHGRRKGAKRAGQAASSTKPKPLTKKELLAAEHKRRKEMEEIGKTLLEQQKQKVKPQETRGAERSKNTHNQKQSIQTEVDMEIKKQEEQARKQLVILESKLKICDAQEKKNEKRRKKREMKQLKKQNQLEAKQHLQEGQLCEPKVVAQSCKLKEKQQSELYSLEPFPKLKDNPAKKKTNYLPNLPPRLRALEANKGHDHGPCNMKQKETSKAELITKMINRSDKSTQNNVDMTKSYSSLRKQDEKENLQTKITALSDFKQKDHRRPFEVENDPNLNTYHIQQYSTLMKAQPERHTQWQLKGMGSLQYLKSELLKKQQEKEARRNQEEIDELKNCEQQNHQRNPLTPEPLCYPIRNGPLPCTHAQIGKLKETGYNLWERRKCLLEELTPKSAEDEEAMLNHAMTLSMQPVQQQDGLKEQRPATALKTGACSMNNVEDLLDCKDTSQPRLNVNCWSDPASVIPHSNYSSIRPDDAFSSENSDDDLPEGAFCEYKACPGYTQYVPSFTKLKGAEEKSTSKSNPVDNGNDNIPSFSTSSDFSSSSCKIKEKIPKWHKYINFSPTYDLFPCPDNCDCFNDQPDNQSDTISDFDTDAQFVNMTNLERVTYESSEQSDKVTKRHSINVKNKVDNAEHVKNGYQSDLIGEDDFTEKDVQPILQNARKNNMAASLLSQRFSRDSTETCYTQSTVFQTGAQEENGILSVNLKTVGSAGTHVGIHTTKADLQEKSTETHEKQEIKVAENCVMAKSDVLPIDTNTGSRRQNMDHVNSSGQLTSDIHSENEIQNAEDKDEQRENGLSLETEQQVTGDVDSDVHIMNQKILGTSNIWSVNGPSDGSGDASACRDSRPTVKNILPGLPLSNTGAMPGLPLVLPDNLALYMQYLAYQTTLAMMTNFPLVPPFSVPPGLGAVPLSGIPMIPIVSTATPTKSIPPRIYDHAIHQLDPTPCLSSPPNKNSLITDSSSAAVESLVDLHNPESYKEEINEPVTEPSSVSDDKAFENKEKFEITARLPRKGFSTRQTLSGLQQVENQQSLLQSAIDPKRQNCENFLVSEGLSRHVFLPQTQETLNYQDCPQIQEYKHDEGVVITRGLHENRQGSTQNSADYIEQGFPSRQELENSIQLHLKQELDNCQGFVAKPRQESQNRKGFPPRQEPQNTQGFQPRQESQIRTGFPPKQELQNTLSFQPRQEPQRRTGFPLKEEHQNNQGFQPRQEPQRRTGFPLKEEHQNNQGFQPRQEPQRRTGFPPKDEHQNNQGFQPRQEPQRRTGFPPKDEHQNNQGFQPRQEPQRRTGFPLKEEHQNNQGFQPRQESQRRTGFPPKEEHQNNQGFQPRQEPQRRTEFPPKEEHQNSQGFQPRQEPQRRTGFPPKDEHQNSQGFQPRQESQRRTGFPPKKEHQNNQGFLPRQEPQRRTGFPPKEEHQNNQGFQPRQEPQRRTGFPPKDEHQNNQGFQPRQEPQRRTGFPLKEEHQNNQGFQPRQESQRRTGFPPKEEHQNNQGFQPRQEPQRRTGFPPKDEHQNSQDFQPRQEPQRRTVFPPKDEHQNNQGFQPRQEPQRRTGFPPKEEHQNNQGFQPRQEPQRRTGFPPKEEHQNNQGFQPRQEPQKRTGFPPKEEHQNKRSFQPRQEPQNKQDYPSRPDSQNRQVFPPRQDSRHSQGFYPGQSSQNSLDGHLIPGNNSKQSLTPRQDSHKRQDFTPRSADQFSQGLAKSTGKECPPEQVFSTKQIGLNSWGQKLASNSGNPSLDDKIHGQKSQHSPARMVRRPPQLPQFVTKGVTFKSFSQIVTDSNSITSRRQATPDVLNTIERRGY